MDINLNQDSPLAENDLNTDVDRTDRRFQWKYGRYGWNIRLLQTLVQSSMEETNGEMNNIKIQNMIKKALMENEKKMDAYKEEMNKEIKTLRTQIQNQTLKMDDMKLRLEMIGIHVPADVANVSLLCESRIKRRTKMIIQFLTH